MKRWNIHPGNGTWIKCYIWPDIESMHDATEKRLQYGGRDHLACFIGIPEYTFYNDDTLIQRKLGEIHLVEGEFGSGIVAHELQHFIIQYASRLEWDVMDIHGEWETIAHLAGNLTCQFWNEFYQCA